MTCLCDYGEATLAAFETSRTCARREHECQECYATINPGQVYHRAKGVVPGDGWWSAVACLPCAEALVELQRECRGTMYGGVLVELLEDFRAEHFDTVPPHLAGHLGGVMWRWGERRYDRREELRAERRRREAA